MTLRQKLDIASSALLDAARSLESISAGHRFGKDRDPARDTRAYAARASTKARSVLEEIR